MFSDKEREERRKKLHEFFGFTSLPLMLTIVGSIFFEMALVSLTGHKAPPGKGVGLGIGSLSFGLMMGLAVLWARPAYRYLLKPEEELKEKIRVRMGNVYRDGLLMLVIVQALTLVPALLAPGLLPKAKLVAILAAFIAQACTLVLFVDAVLARQKTLMDALYEGGQLYQLRGGFSIPAYLKMTMMVIAFAILPFLLIFTAFLNKVSWELMGTSLLAMLAISTLMLINGITVVYKGMQQPIDGLIRRMKGVAGGDYSKTRIYFSDEIAYLKAGYNDMVEGLKEREELQDTFGKYLSIEIARELIHNKKVNLGGEDMEAAVMFCDIRNFTPLSETMSAGALVEFLNKYFHYITPPITAHNGVINKFLGDAVMAIYTPMLGSADYAADAVRAAVGMRAALAEFNASGQAPGRVEFGVGIHCGKLVAGNIGTKARLEYTFIGDTVNIASRLESKTKELNTDIVVSAAAMERARSTLGGGIKFEPLGRAALKGKSEQLEIYKVA